METIWLAPQPTVKLVNVNVASGAPTPLSKKQPRPKDRRISVTFDTAAAKPAENAVSLPKWP